MTSSNREMCRSSDSPKHLQPRISTTSSGSWIRQWRSNWIQILSRFMTTLCRRLGFFHNPTRGWARSERGHKLIAKGQLGFVLIVGAAAQTRYWRERAPDNAPMAPDDETPDTLLAPHNADPAAKHRCSAHHPLPRPHVESQPEYGGTAAFERAPDVADALRRSRGGARANLPLFHLLEQRSDRSRQDSLPRPHPESQGAAEPEAPEAVHGRPGRP